MTERTDNPPPALIELTRDCREARTCGNCDAIIVPEPGQTIRVGDYARCPRCGGTNVFKPDGSLRHIGGIPPGAE